MKEEMILVLDIDNVQDAYAMCMETIVFIEKREEKDLEFFRRGNVIKYGKIPKNFFKVQDLWKKKYQRLIENTERILSREKKEHQEFFRLARESDVLFKATQNLEIYYEIRINFRENDDIIEMQYLLAMLQGMGEMARKVCVFFVPFSNYYDSEKGDFSLYYKISHYLRFMQYDNFFSAFGTKGQAIIAPLTKKKPGIQTTFIPALEINSKSYLALSENILNEGKADGIKK